LSYSRLIIHRRPIGATPTARAV